MCPTDPTPADPGPSSGTPVTVMRLAERILGSGHRRVARHPLLAFGATPETQVAAEPWGIVGPERRGTQEGGRWQLAA